MAFAGRGRAGFEGLKRYLSEREPLLHALGTSSVFVNREGRIAWAHPRAEAFGAHPVESVGKTLGEVFSQAAAEKIAASVGKNFKNRGEEQVISIGGRKVELRANPVVEGGKVIAAGLVLRDLSAVEEANDALEKQAAELKTANINLNAKTSLLRANHRISRMIAATENPEDILNVLARETHKLLGGSGALVFEKRRGSDLFPASVSGLDEKAHGLVLDSGKKSLAGAIANRRKATAFSPEQTRALLQHKWFGERYGGNILGAPIRVGDELQGVLMHVRKGLPRTAGSEDHVEIIQHLADLTAIVLKNARLASYDGLTGLFNRLKLESIYENEVRRASSQKAPITILFADGDKIKSANDEYGHKFGDKVLKSIGNAHSNALIRFKREVSRDVRPVSGRYGGDEFVTIIPSGAEHAKQFKKILLEEMEKQRAEGNFTPKGHKDPHPVSLSIGISSTDEGLAPDKLLQEADDVMYGYKAARIPHTKSVREYLGWWKEFFSFGRKWWKLRPRIMHLTPGIGGKLYERAQRRSIMRAEKKTGRRNAK